MPHDRPDDSGEVLLYRTEDGRTALDVRLAGETVWLTQAQIAELFALKVPAISKHIKNIYDDRELARKETISKLETVRTEGKRQVARTVELYNLDMIISVGYSVNSARATRFRIWATQTLKEHLTQGYPYIADASSKTRGNWKQPSRSSARPPAARPSPATKAAAWLMSSPATPEPSCCCSATTKGC